MTLFNGGQFRRRPIVQVIEEFTLIKEKHILIVDDNLIRTTQEQVSQTKELFRSIIQSKMHKKWICQVTINMVDDDELLELAKKAGCIGVFIGFESISNEELQEVNKKFVVKRNRNVKTLIQRIQQHRIVMIGSFILGLNIDRKSIGTAMAKAAQRYGLDILNVMLLTPLPGTRLWDALNQENRIVATHFPIDWNFYTPTFPVPLYKSFSWKELGQERTECHKIFYSYKKML